MEVREIIAKNIIVKSKLPDTDYVINPYTGCSFACAYCYASFMGRFVDQPIENWGNYVYVKVNTVELFQNEIKSFLKRPFPKPRILLSSVTDPYQGVEAKYKLTRGIFETIVDKGYDGLVSILTKSPMVLRDIDLLKSVKNLEVGLTITSTNDRLSKWAEVKAPLISQRIETLKTLKRHGIRTYAFIGPLFPHFESMLHEMESIFKALAEAEVDSVFIEHINLSKYIMARMTPVLQNESQEIKKFYSSATSKIHQEKLENFISKVIKKYKLNLRLNQVIYHKELPS